MDFLTFEELQSLLSYPSIPQPLGRKLEKFWTTPLISNEAYYQGIRPGKLVHPQLGHILSVASWNIEKSFHIPRVIELLTSEEAFRSMLDPSKASPDSKEYQDIARQHTRLRVSDILILQEMDIGVQRSNYLNAAAELAKALQMNFAYGAEQLEIDPVLLGMEKATREDGSPDESHDFDVDPLRYKGVFGSAVLSRYPIKKAEVFQLKTQGYDWFTGEKPKISLVEKTRRLGTKVLFRNELSREMKVGGRHYFRVDLEVPELPLKTLTVINVHLEIKCLPKAREFQMAEILSYIKDIPHPVILMGDFNSAAHDISPTSLTRVVTRTAKNPSTWLNAGINLLTPYGPLNVTRNAVNLTRGFQDPLARDIPGIGPNPVYGLFQEIKEFRFTDQRVFDFRGDKKRSIGRKNELLANANQRDLKGFKTTFQVRRPIGPLLGKLRLDWVFVKSYLQDPEDRLSPYQFSPHFGETLEELNTSLKEPVSDHHPNVVDLPFEEPSLDAFH